jgi:hypothetical protein
MHYSSSVVVSLNSSWNSPKCAIDKHYSTANMELQKHIEEVLLAKQPLVGGLKWKHALP